MRQIAVHYRKLVRFSGVYDLIASFPFALPGLGLSGRFPVFEPVHLFFLKLMGSIVTVWSVLRIVKPEPLFGLADGMARAAFSCLMLYYLVVWSIPQVVVLFLVPEVLFGIAQLGGYWLCCQAA